jgi:hypothetical protein
MLAGCLAHQLLGFQETAGWHLAAGQHNQARLPARNQVLMTCSHCPAPLHQAAASQLAQFPRQVRLELLPGGGVPAGPAGVLHVRLLALYDLASTGYIRRPKPYVVLQVWGGGCQWWAGLSAA